jgi:ArsR family transcriptional regulator
MHVKDRICAIAHETAIDIATQELAMDDLDTVLDSLAEPTRRRALALLWAGQELCVCELMERLGATQSRMSRHMGVLKAAGLVLDRREAQWVRYRRNPGVARSVANVIDAVIAARSIAEDSAAQRSRRKGHKQGAAA